MKEIQKAFELAMSLGWNSKPAKLDGRMNLLSHSLNAMAIAERLIQAYEKFGVFKFSEVEKRIITGALFIHDFSKADEDISRQIANGNLEELPKRLKGRDDVKNALTKLGLNDEEAEKAIDYAVLMERPQPSDLIEFLSCRPISGKIDRILKLSDRLAGIKSIEDARQSSISRLIEPLEVKIHKVSVIRGVSTQLLHRAIQRLMEKTNWMAITSTPDGTVYMGKGDVKIEKNELFSTLFDELKKFMNSFDSMEIGSAAFGNFTNRPIKAPEFIFISKKTAESFWRFIESKDAISNPKDLPKNPRGGDRKNFDALQAAKPDLSFEEYKNLYKLYNSMRYTLMMEISVLREMKKLNESLYEHAVSHLTKSGVNVKALLDANPRYNSPFKEVIEGVDSFINNLGIENKKRDEITKETLKLFREATIKAVEEVGVEIPSLSISLQLLLADLSVPRIEDADWREAYKRYEKGKIKGTPVCPLCGSEADNLGVAALIGDGTESFSNMLPGGSTIGGENKVKICNLCEFEAKLRSLIMGSGSVDVFYIIPQCIIAPNLSDYFWTEAKKKLELGCMSGSEIPSIYDLYSWAQIVIDGGFKENISKSFIEILQSTVENACKDKKIRKLVKTALEEHYEGSLENLKEFTGLNISTIEDVITLVFEGDTDIIEALGIEESLKTRPKVGVALSNNYVVLLFSDRLRKRVQRKDEPETTYLLRKLFVALIISEMFSASVIASDLPISSLYSPAPKGAVRVPVKLGLREFLKPYLKDGWIPFDKTNLLMRKLAAMLLIEKTMSEVNADYGAVTLYELTKRSPGMVLNRTVQHSNKVNLKKFLKLLKEVGS